MNSFPSLPSLIISSLLSCAFCSAATNLPFLSCVSKNLSVSSGKKLTGKGLFACRRGHRGHRGEKGERGPKGRRGKRGATGEGTAPAYIQRSEVLGEEVPVVAGSILPLGNNDNSLVPLHLEYVDPNPMDLSQDRYIHVLRGGGGTYLMEYSFLLIAGDAPMHVQVQVSHNGGPYNTSRAIDIFISNPSLYTGTRTNILSLQEGDRVHLLVMDGSVIGDPAFALDRVVDVTMARIG